MTRLSRREALGFLGTTAGGGLLALHGIRLDAQAPTFPRGAIIRTLLRDVPPDAIKGSTLFHEHLSIRYPLTKALATAQGRPVPASFTDDVDLMIEIIRKARGHQQALAVASAFVSGYRIDRCSWNSVEPLIASGAT